MCTWVTTQYWTSCGCTVKTEEHKPGCDRPECETIELPVQTWEGYCQRPQCPNPKP